MEEPLEPVTMRNHVCTLAERLEDELGDEQVAFEDVFRRWYPGCRAYTQSVFA
jgi:hypothetical protein